jgi:hypothetical protein
MSASSIRSSRSDTTRSIPGATEIASGATAAPASIIDATPYIG